MGVLDFVLRRLRGRSGRALAKAAAEELHDRVFEEADEVRRNIEGSARAFEEQRAKKRRAEEEAREKIRTDREIARELEALKERVEEDG